MLKLGLRHPRAPKQQPTRKSIAVVGAGLAGLCAAYELNALGYEVRVYEARGRVGGRVHSLPNFVRGKTVEGGGELIGSNHPLWNWYKQHFGLRFSDTQDYGNSPVRFGTCTLTFEESKKLTDDIERGLKELTALAESILDPFEPWTNRNAKRLDRISLAAWIKKLKCTKLGKKAIAGMLEADNGTPAAKQSLLGILAMIKGGGLDRYWTDSELFRCRGGNQQLAEKFRKALNRQKKKVSLNTSVESIEKQGEKVAIKLAVKGKRRVKPKYADEVILAVPPSVWHRIKFLDDKPSKNRHPLSKLLRKAPRMGENVKYLMRFRERFWQQYASGPTLSQDGPVDLTWETTEAAKNGDYAMVAFSGSRDAKECVSWTPTQRQKRYLDNLQPPYPGISRQLRNGKFMNWPAEKWTEASYYFPRLKEVTTWGPFWKTGYGGWLHFAGEHTCYAFIGYMEGALNSGYRLARRLAVRDRIFTA